LEQYLGEIRLVSFNFAPKYWAQCNGQLLPINQYQALFALLGTYFGGNGTTNFALPDMRGRAPVSQSQNGQYPLGMKQGTENVTLNSTEIPQHNHFVQAVNSAGATQRAINNLLARSASATGPGAVYTASPANLTALNQASIQPYGGSQPHNNMQPYLAMTYCIALQGIFPSRN
jgi:microcystin-dependent protein